MNNSFVFIALSCRIIIASSLAFTLINEDISNHLFTGVQIDRKYNDREYEDLFSGNVIHSSNLDFDIDDHESAMAAYEKYREETPKIMLRYGQIEREYIDRERDSSATRDDIFLKIVILLFMKVKLQK